MHWISKFNANEIDGPSKTGKLPNTIIIYLLVSTFDTRENNAIHFC